MSSPEIKADIAPKDPIPPINLPLFLPSSVNLVKILVKPKDKKVELNILFQLT